jgi:hypothetical protein
MARPKGLPKTGGRKKGCRNKITVAREIVAADPALANLNPVDFMLAVMRTPHFPVSTRLDAAAKAAPYKNPRLSSVDINQRPTDPYAGKSTQELNALFMAELAKRGLMLVDIPDESTEPGGLNSR